MENIHLTKFDLPHFQLDLTVGGGTYVRSLCRDIGEAVGSVATMTSLIRTQHGPFTIDDCIKYDDLIDASAKTIYEHIVRNNDKFNFVLDEH